MKDKLPIIVNCLRQQYILIFRDITHNYINFVKILKKIIDQEYIFRFQANLVAMCSEVSVTGSFTGR